MLIKWGLDIADELHIPAYLESSPVGHKLYQKFGFRDIDELILDPKWNYGSADPRIYFMLREADQKESSLLAGKSGEASGTA